MLRFFVSEEHGRMPVSSPLFIMKTGKGGGCCSAGQKSRLRVPPSGAGDCQDLSWLSKPGRVEVEIPRAARENFEGSEFWFSQVADLQSVANGQKNAS